MYGSFVLYPVAKYCSSEFTVTARELLVISVLIENIFKRDVIKYVTNVYSIKPEFTGKKI